MNHKASETAGRCGRLLHPMLVELISALYALTSMAFITTAAVSWGSDDLLARPPRMAWRFLAVFVIGMGLATFLHFRLLAWLRGGRTWPDRLRRSWRLLGPIAGIVVACLVSLVLQPTTGPLIVLTLTMLAVIVVGLIPTLICLLDCLQDQTKRLEEPVRLTRLVPADLPGKVRSYFDSQTDELLRSGFQWIGDFQLKQHTPSFGRFFLNPDSDTFAELNHTQVLVLTRRTACFFSLTPQGYYLESASVRLLGQRPATANFELQSVPVASLVEVYQQHQRRLRQLDGGQPRHLRAEDLEPVICCGNKRLYDLLIAQGRARMNPYADFDDASLRFNIEEIDVTLPASTA